MVTRRNLVKGLAVSPLVGSALVAAPRLTSVQAQDGDAVAIGSKNFPEQFILGEMYALLLEDAGIEVERKLNLAGTNIAHEALVKGDIDLYPEYTGTGLTVVLGRSLESVLAGATPVAGGTDASATPAAGGSVDELVYQVVKDGYLAEFNLVWLDQVPFNNTQALAMKRSVAEEKGIVTISDMVAQAPDLKISAPVDFAEREEDGYPALQRVYGAFEFSEVVGVDPGVKYQALLDDEAQVVLAFGTDGEIFGNDLVILEDDLGLWPPYHVAPVVRQEALDANPLLAETLNKVAPLLTDEVMSGLNWQVSGDEKAEPADVARQFLEENGLLTA